MTKKISLLIFMVYSLFVLSGCGILDLSKTNVDEDSATEGEKVVAKLHNHICSNSLGNFEDYFVAGDATEEMYTKLTERNTLSAELNNAIDYILEYVSEDVAKEWVETFATKFYGAGDYIIDNVTVDGETVNVTITMQLPDFSNITEIPSEDMNAILRRSFGFDANDSDLFFSELAFRKGVDETALRDIYSGSDENVWIGDILEVFSEEIHSAFERVTDQIFTDCPMKDYKIYYTVEKQADNTWKITDVDND